MRLKRIAAALLGAGVCTAAQADPASMAAFLASYAYAQGAIQIGTFLAIQAASIVVGTAMARQSQRQQDRLARAAFNASLQDRTVTVKSAVAARSVIYGRTMVGGALVFAHTSGTRSEFLHLVVALAGHQIDAVEQVWFGDVALPPVDGSFMVPSGQFALAIDAERETIFERAVVGDTVSSLTLPAVPARVVAVTDVVGVELREGIDWTRSGAVITFTAPQFQRSDYRVFWTETTSFTPRVRIRSYTGAPGQVADPDLIAASGGRWTSQHIGTGIAYLYIRLEYDQQVFGQIGVPEIKAVVRGKRVFDPRTSTTAWTNNAALCTRDFLLDPVHGLGADASEIVASEVIAAANICDEEVILYTTGTVAVTNGSATVTGTGTAWASRARPGMLLRGPNGVSMTIASVASDTSLTLTANYTGTTTSGAAYSLRQIRYQVGGTLSTETSRRDSLEALVTAMAGSAVYVQGRWLVRAGAARVSEMTITVDHLADGQISIQPRTPRASLFNTVSGTFISRAQQYATSQWPEVTSAFYRTQDGGQRIARELSLPLTDDPTACQRLGKIMLERSRQALIVTLTTNLRAYDLVPSDWVSLTVARYGWSAKVFEVVARRWTPGGAIEYTMRETAAAVYDWALGDQTAVDLAPNSNLPNPYAPPAALTGLTVASGTAQLRVLADGSIITQGLVQWAQSTDIFTVRGGRIEVEWKLDNETSWQAAPSEPGDATSAIIGPLDDRRITLVRVRPVNSLGRFGAWTTVVHVVVGKSAAPVDVAGLTATVIPGAVRISWTRPSDLDYEATELRRGASWAAGVRLDNGAAGSLSISGTGYDWVPPAIGSYTILARHRDTSGNLSSAVATTTVSVNASTLEITNASLLPEINRARGTNLWTSNLAAVTGSTLGGAVSNPARPDPLGTNTAIEVTLPAAGSFVYWRMEGLATGFYTVRLNVLVVSSMSAVVSTGDGTSWGSWARAETASASAVWVQVSLRQYTNTGVLHIHFGAFVGTPPQNTVPASTVVAVSDLWVEREQYSGDLDATRGAPVGTTVGGVSAGVVAGFTSGPNLLLNGNFESGVDEWALEHSDNSGAVMEALLQSNAAVGNVVMQLAGARACAVSRAIAVSPGQSYRVRFRYRAINATVEFYWYVGLSLARPPDGYNGYPETVPNWLPLPGTYPGTVGASAVWSTYDAVYTVPAGMCWLSLGLHRWTGSGPTALLQIDDVSVSQLTDTGGLAVQAVTDVVAYLDAAGVGFSSGS